MADIAPSSDHACVYFKKLQKLRDVVDPAGLQEYWPELKGASIWREYWVASGLAQNIDNFTVDDFKILVCCIPEDNGPDQWQVNVKNLYSEDLALFGRFDTAEARRDAFLFVSKYPPKRCWDLTNLDHRITRAISVLSYIAPIKNTSFIFLDRLRPLCLENHSHVGLKAPRKGWCCAKEKCEIWKDEALELQSAILKFAEQHIPHDAMLLPEEFIEMDRSLWKLYHAQPHWQPLKAMVASERSPEEEKWITLKFATALHQEKFRQIVRPKKWITLKVTTALGQKILRHILRQEKLASGFEPDSLSTMKIGIFGPGNDPPASALVDSPFRDIDKARGATSPQNCDLHSVSLQREQSLSAMTPSFHPTQADMNAPSAKRKCLSSASAKHRGFTSQKPCQHATDMGQPRKEKSLKFRKRLPTKPTSTVYVPLSRR